MQMRSLDTCVTYCVVRKKEAGQGLMWRFLFDHQVDIASRCRWWACAASSYASMPANAPPSPNGFFLLHETPVAAALIDSSAFIRHEHSTASSNNTSTTTKFPSSNQIRWAPIHNMQIDKHQQLQLQLSSPPRGAPSHMLASITRTCRHGLLWLLARL